jgi:hypothetical protein
MGSIFSAALDRTAARLDRWLGRDRLPLPLAILTLVGLRGRLRNENWPDFDADAPTPSLRIVPRA